MTHIMDRFRMAAFAERRMHQGFCKVLGIVLLGQGFAGAIHGQEVAYTGSLQVGAGDYIFSERTFTLYLFSGLTVEEGPFRFSTNVPVIVQSTPWISYGGAGMLPTGGGQHAEVDHRNDGEDVVLSDEGESRLVGLGDPVSRLDVEAVTERRMFPSVHLLAEVKFPLADVRHGFGTGRWDYGAGFSVSKTVRERSYSFELLYISLGDLPELELRDPVSFYFAVGQPLADGAFDVLVSLSGYSRVVEDVEHPALFGVDLVHHLDSRNRILVGAGFGITESSPDVLLSLGWRIGS